MRIKVNEKIQNTLDFFMNKEKDKQRPYLFYGHFCLSINFVESKDVPTAGVYISSGLNGLRRGMTMLYNNDFVNGLSQKEVNFLIIHELYHLLNRHISRTKKSDHDEKLANIAQDLVINHDILKDHGSDDMSMIEGGLLFENMPKKYEGDNVYELVYNWLLENRENFSSVAHGAIDEHINNEVDDSIAEKMVKREIDSLKNKGITSANVEDLFYPKVINKNMWLKRLATNIQKLSSSSYKKTYNMPNRRGIEGVKGRQRKSEGLTVVLDTSGSMWKILDEISSFLIDGKRTINLIQADTEVKTVDQIKTLKDLQNIKKIGSGGTIIQPALNYIRSDQVLRKQNVLLITDGYTDTLNFSGINKSVILYTDVECNISNGRVIQQKIKNFD